MLDFGEVRIRIGCANRAVRRVRMWKWVKRRDLQRGFLALWGGYKRGWVCARMEVETIPPRKTEGVDTPRKEAVTGPGSWEGQLSFNTPLKLQRKVLSELPDSSSFGPKHLNLKHESQLERKLIINTHIKSQTINFSSKFLSYMHMSCGRHCF